MLILTKSSKYDSVDPRYFIKIDITPVGADDENYESRKYVNELLPMGLYAQLSGGLSKKKFKKLYLKYIKKALNFKYGLFTYVISPLSKGMSVALFVQDDYYKVVSDVLKSSLEEPLGLNILNHKEGKKEMKDILAGLDKKDRKLLKLDLDEMTKKQISKKKKLLKSMRDESTDNIDTVFDKLDKVFAIDQVIFALIEKGVIAYKENTVNVATDVPSRIKKIASKALFMTYDNAPKATAKLIKAIARDPVYGIKKINTKSIKKLDGKSIVILCATIAAKIAEYRVEEVKDILD